jgi:hypothetical protein
VILRKGSEAVGPMLKIPTGMKEILRRQISRPFSPSSPALLLDVSTGNCQRALVNESGIVITQTGTQNRSEMFAVHGTPCAKPPHSSNDNTGSSSSNSLFFVRKPSGASTIVCIRRTQHTRRKELAHEKDLRMTG